MKLGEMIMPRVTFGNTLVEIADEYPKMRVFDADVGASTQTAIFRDAYPDRFYQMGIAEANMVGTAAGMASTGLIPFVSTFAIFLTKRAGDQIRNSIAYPHMNVKLNGSYGGLPTGKAGATHSAIEDLAVMRAMPGMTILVPADPRETREATKLAIEIDGPVYLRTVRCPVPVIFAKCHRMELGKGEIIHDGRNAVIISTGMMTPKALQAVREMEAEGIMVKLIHMGTLKPIDKEIIAEAASEFGHIITVENHSVIGGLGSAVAEVAADLCPCRVTRLGFQDLFVESGDDEKLFTLYGMNVDNIKNTVRSIL
jgi:transketolase